MSKQLEQEILEDINKILIKLSGIEDANLTSDNEGRYFIPTADYVDEDDCLDEDGNLKPDARFFQGGYSDPVKFAEQYENVKLSTIKTLLQLLIVNKKGKDSERSLTDAEHILAQYYNSNC